MDEQAKADLKESLEALIASAGDVADDVKSFAEAVVDEIKGALKELGEATPDYPTPVRNAIDVLKGIVEALETGRA